MSSEADGSQTDHCPPHLGICRPLVTLPSSCRAVASVRQRRLLRTQRAGTRRLRTGGRQGLQSQPFYPEFQRLPIMVSAVVAEPASRPSGLARSFAGGRCRTVLGPLSLDAPQPRSGHSPGSTSLSSGWTPGRLCELHCAAQQPQPHGLIQ